MHITFGEHLIEFNRWESQKQMTRYLLDCPAGSLILGEGTEVPREFYVVTLHLGPEGDRFGIGICSEGHGLVPQMLPLVEEGILIFGFNREVVAFSVRDKKVRFRMQTPVLFHRFIFLSEHGMILVFDEIGVMALTPDGRCLWHYEQDLLTNHRLVGNRLILEFMDSPGVSLDLLTGSVLSVP